jgi:hypothetical protein
MNDTEKLDNMLKVGDAAATTLLVASWTGWVPVIASLLTAIYISIRIWETQTVQGWRQAIKNQLFRRD